MKKSLILLFMIINLFICINKTDNVIAQSNDNIYKPLVLLKGYDYSKYLQLDGFSIVSSTLNTNMTGDYKIIYRNDITKEEFEKRIYVKDKNDFINDKCYSENLLAIYGTSNRLVVQQALFYDGYYYIVVAEEIDVDIYSLYLLKLQNETLVYKQEILSSARASTVTDIVINDDEICLLVNYNNNENQDIMLVFISHDGQILDDYKIYGNNYDYGTNIVFYNTKYYITVESNSNNNIYDQTSTLKKIYFIVFDKRSRQIEKVENISDEYNLDIVDAIHTDEGLLLLSYKYDPIIQLKVYELHLYDYYKKQLVLSSMFKKTLYEKPFQFKANDRNEIYLMTESLGNIGQKEFNLYYIFPNLKYQLRTSYCYENSVNAYICDYLVNEYNNVEVLYKITNSQEENQGGYMYQMIEQDKVAFEIEQYDSRYNCYSFVNDNEILLLDNNVIVSDQISYMCFDNLVNEFVISYNQDIDIPYLYNEGTKIKLNNDMSKLDYDINNFGLYDIYLYYNLNNVDLICGGKVEVLPYVNVENNEVYDINIKLKFNGQAKLNNYYIENDYIIREPGSYILELIGKDLCEYKVIFDVKNISNNENIVQEQKNNLTIKKEMFFEQEEIKVYNNISEITNSKKQNHMWIVILPICSLIVLLFNILKRRG